MSAAYRCQYPPCISGYGPDLQSGQVHLATASSLGRWASLSGWRLRLWAACLGRESHSWHRCSVSVDVSCCSRPRWHSALVRHRKSSRYLVLPYSSYPLCAGMRLASSLFLKPSFFEVDEAYHVVHVLRQNLGYKLHQRRVQEVSALRL